MQGISMYINVYHGLIMVQKNGLSRPTPSPPGLHRSQGALQMLFTAPVQLHCSLQRGLRSRPVAQIWHPARNGRGKNTGEINWNGVNMGLTWLKELVKTLKKNEELS